MTGEQFGGMHGALEALGFDGYGVGADTQVGDHVFTRRAGFEHALGASLDAGDANGSLWDGCSRGVRDSSEDRAFRRLPGQMKGQ